MDVDAFVMAHRPTWDRLEQLVKRRRRLTGAEVDELVDLYQRVSTHLSMVRSASQDSVLVGRLSGLVARARAAVTGAHAPLWREFVRFWTVSFPVVAYRSWRWWLGSAVAFFIVTVALALWVSGNPDVHAAIGTPSEIDELVNHDFASYYSEHPAGSFALQVWVNNSWVAAQCIGFAILLGLPIPYVLFQNAANLGVIAGLMFSAGKGDLFLGLITPHGLLEMTAVFLAAAVGMRLGWTVISPGDRPRGQVLAEQGRAVVAAAIGLAAVLLVSGLVEALVTPSPLPTWVRIVIGVAVELAFLGYVFHFGRKAVRAGETGDLEDAPDVIPIG
ncbi:MULTISPECIES: stage II sporulation protein M [unclassified Mycolicibacterium]|uniref:stage II sporulation protein M n=1 Tax=unclassified Mycolicibacterium TaxID=2636767 RepID=UPI00130BBBF5|nr:MULTISPECIES: stage II sporulation protein M [unclassified Mycolicibacterium]MUL84207.1 stage II sporulation protein M [Mycolicibacterium sp. CBMA 329]MUL89727.1 stage II sporulation protein M [Mycolicibacterium sp. CBMA 331]MUL99902.1 stage II sporulation protein M [Mycolicibacterium sp. CBMA 334]MUM27056.1 stage II sporulation protein M [Mycolicibacterium sp. CBMA 295]MUM39242.1 stage II sporulation protein M [Mycolicibacterium sp. CBMA 247]